MMRWHRDFTPARIKGVDVFLERSQTRQHVGVLDRHHQKFRFVYEDTYLKAKSIIPLGPEFPLTQKEFVSDTLFPSLGDRLPDRDNPAYIDYCTAVGIAVSVDDPIILLATIGRRGPSSFIFEPIYNESFSFKECEKWREELGLSMQDFAHLFDVSLSILQKMKAGTSSGKEVLQRLELYWRIPEAFGYQLETQGKWLEQQKYKKVSEWLENKMKENILNPLDENEVNYTQECIKRLQGTPWATWATALISKINKDGLNMSSRTLMFEIRFGDALARAGFEIKNAYKADVGDTDVDFSFEHEGKRWLIELTSAQESSAVRSATSRLNDSLFLYRSDHHAEGRDCDVGTAERIKMRNIIFGKVTKIKKEEVNPIKFPPPKGNNYNVIIVDTRGFGKGYNDGDWKDVCYGDPQLEDFIKDNKYQWDTTGNKYFKHRLDISEATRGVFSPHNNEPRAHYMRERIHAVGFICERKYEEGEMENILMLCANPNLINRKEMEDIWPLKKDPNYQPNSSSYSPPDPTEEIPIDLQSQEEVYHHLCEYVNIIQQNPNELLVFNRLLSKLDN